MRSEWIDKFVLMVVGGMTPWEAAATYYTPKFYEISVGLASNRKAVLQKVLNDHSALNDEIIASALRTGINF